jgi:hypothetical protein
MPQKPGELSHALTWTDNSNSRKAAQIDGRRRAIRPTRVRRVSG